MRNLITDLISYLIPIRINEVYSSINGKILVEKYCASLRLTVDWYWQSGRYAEELISKALKVIPNNKTKIKNILLLGLAGGSFIKVLRQSYPESTITAIDLDPVIVSLGQKYFGLDKIKNLKIQIFEASEFVKKAKKNHYDLIIMDIFIGCNTPSSVETESYLKNLFKILRKEGVLIVNRSNLPKYRNITDAFVKKVKKRFSKVNLVISNPNLLIIAYK